MRPLALLSGVTLIAITNAAPTLNLSTSDSRYPMSTSYNLSSHDSSITCLEFKTAPSNAFERCKEAISLFPVDHPNDPNPAAFSEDGKGTRFSLPNLKGSKEFACIASVELVGLLPVDYSKWSQLRERLNAVYDGCLADKGEDPRRYGGYAMTGDFGGIRVSLRPFMGMSSEGLAMNATGLSALGHSNSSQVVQYLPGFARHASSDANFGV